MAPGHVGRRWNISLLPYRNHGADFGRVLAGFEVPEADRPAFLGFLANVGYPYRLDPTMTRTGCFYPERDGAAAPAVWASAARLIASRTAA